MRFKWKRKYSLLGGNNLPEMNRWDTTQLLKSIQAQGLLTSVERNCNSSIIKLKYFSISRCLNTHTHYLASYLTVTIHTLNLVRLINCWYTSMVKRIILLPNQHEPHQFLHGKPVEEKTLKSFILHWKKKDNVITHMFPNSTS